MRRIRSEPALLLQREVNALKDIVERHGQLPKLITWIANREAFVEVARADAFRLRRHRRNGVECTPRQRVTHADRQQDRDRQCDQQSGLRSFEQLGSFAEWL